MFPPFYCFWCAREISVSGCLFTNQIFDRSNGAGQSHDHIHSLRAWDSSSYWDTSASYRDWHVAWYLSYPDVVGTTQPSDFQPQRPLQWLCWWVGAWKGPRAPGPMPPEDILTGTCWKAGRNCHQRAAWHASERTIPYTRVSGTATTSILMPKEQTVLLTHISNVGRLWVITTLCHLNNTDGILDERFKTRQRIIPPLEQNNSKSKHLEHLTKTAGN